VDFGLSFDGHLNVMCMDLGFWYLTNAM